MVIICAFLLIEGTNFPCLEPIPKTLPPKAATFG